MEEDIYGAEIPLMVCRWSKMESEMVIDNAADIERRSRLDTIRPK